MCIPRIPILKRSSVVCLMFANEVINLPQKQTKNFQHQHTYLLDTNNVFYTQASLMYQGPYSQNLFIRNIYIAFFLASFKSNKIKCLFFRKMYECYNNQTWFHAQGLLNILRYFWNCFELIMFWLLVTVKLCLICLKSNQI